MPHIIIEYADDVISTEGARLMTEVVFVAVEETGLFAPFNIKVRAVPVSVYKLGLEGGGFIHVQCRIHKGRDHDQKKRLTSTIVDALKAMLIDVAVITAEVIDMDRESYSKHTI